MTEAEAIKVLEKEKAYMDSHGGDTQSKALEMAINALEKQTKIKEFTKLYEKAFDWGCNDEATCRYANAIYSIVSGNEIFKECEQEFLDYMAER